jgi:hypothetical protein
MEGRWKKTLRPMPDRRRHLYTAAEDDEIIAFVRVFGRSSGLSPNGQNLWTIAEAKGICGGRRSAQSLEGRWKKTIRPRLELD